MDVKILAESLRGYAASTILEALGQRGALSHLIRPAFKGAALVGVAYTVRTPPGQTRAVLRAVSQAPAGSVIAVDCGGGAEATVWGGTSSRAGAARGLAGCITNGAVRDLAEIEAIALPVFCTGTNVRGTAKDHPGQTQVPVDLGGCRIEPGDLIVADADGAVHVPRHEFATLLDRVQARHASEQEIDRRVQAGEDLLGILRLD